MPFEAAGNFPDDLFILLGYARGAYQLGYVDDRLDPIEVVCPGEPELVRRDPDQ